MKKNNAPPMPNPKDAGKPPTFCMCNHQGGDLFCNCGCGDWEKYQVTHKISLSDRLLRWTALHDL